MIPVLLLAAYLIVGAFFAGMSVGSMLVDERIRARYKNGPVVTVVVSLALWPALAVGMARCIHASVKESAR